MASHDSIRATYDYLKPFVAQAYAYLKPFVKRAALNLVRDILKDLADKAIAAANEADQWGQGSSARASAWAGESWPAVERLDRRDNTEDGLSRARRCLSVWAEEGWPAIKRLNEKDGACDGILRIRWCLSAWAREDWPSVEHLVWRNNTRNGLLRTLRHLSNRKVRAYGYSVLSIRILSSLEMLYSSYARVRLFVL